MDEFESLFGSNDEEVSNEEIPTEVETEETEVAEVETEETAEVEETVQETAVETEAEPEPVKPEAPKEVKSETTVPLAALLEEREKARTSKSEVERLQQQIAEMQAAKTNNSEPDPYDDPEGYKAHLRQQIVAEAKQAVLEQKFLDARSRAIAEHGEQFVQELGDWTDEYAATVDPNVGQKALNSPDPVAFIISLKKRQDTLRAIEADPDAYVRQRALELGLIPTVPQQTVETTQPTPKKPVGPKSIASVSSRDSNSNRKGPEASFDAIF